MRPIVRLTVDDHNEKERQVLEDALARLRYATRREYADVEREGGATMR